MQLIKPERGVALRKVYQANRCVCGRPKKNMKPFCPADMQVLGSAEAPRPLLGGALDDEATAAAWEECAAVLYNLGWLKKVVTL